MIFEVKRVGWEPEDTYESWQIEGKALAMD